MNPPKVGATTTLKLVEPPIVRVPTVATTLAPRLVQPGEAETKVTPAGKVSVIVTLIADCGPRLVAISV